MNVSAPSGFMPAISPLRAIFVSVLALSLVACSAALDARHDYDIRSDQALIKTDKRIGPGDGIVIDIYSSTANGFYIKYDIDSKITDSWFQSSRDVSVVLVDSDNYANMLAGYSFTYFSAFSELDSYFISLGWTWYSFESLDRDAYLVIYRQSNNMYSVDVDFEVTVDFRYPESPTRSPPASSPTQSSNTYVCSDYGISTKSDCATKCSGNYRYKTIGSTSGCECFSSSFICVDSAAPEESPANGSNDVSPPYTYSAAPTTASMGVLSLFAVIAYVYCSL